jgi:hypothetical protein
MAEFITTANIALGRAKAIDFGKTEPRSEQIKQIPHLPGLYVIIV